MKKITGIVSLACLMAASVSYGGISITYGTATALKLWDGASLVNLPVNSLVQLVWSADSSVAIPTGTVPGAAEQYGDGDYVLFSKGTTALGGFTDTQMDASAVYQNSNVGGQNILNGYVYVLVFGSSSPIVGSYYGVSSLAFPLNNVEVGTPPPLPNNIAVSSIGVIGPVANGGQGFQVQAVPEPSTVALLLVGIGLVAFRRFSRA